MDILIGIIIRVTIAYFFVLAVIRLSGKRTVKSLSPHDFLVALILGDLFDDIFWAEVTVAQGCTAIAALLMLHILFSYIDYRARRASQVIEGSPSLLFKDGRFHDRALKRERLPRAEVVSQLRIAGIDDQNEVAEIIMEKNGEVSTRKKEAYQQAQKRDLDIAREA